MNRDAIADIIVERLEQKRASRADFSAPFSTIISGTNHLRAVGIFQGEFFHGRPDQKTDDLVLQSGIVMRCHSRHHNRVSSGTAYLRTPGRQSVERWRQ